MTSEYLRLSNKPFYYLTEHGCIFSFRYFFYCSHRLFGSVVNESCYLKAHKAKVLQFTRFEIISAKKEHFNALNQQLVTYQKGLHR